MQFLKYAAVATGMLASVAVNAWPTVNMEVSGLAHLLERFQGGTITNCDVSKAVLPISDGSQSLSPPGAGLILSRVALGRGTQNYTCADSTETSIPVPQGAVADLFDASCFAKRPELLHSLPGLLVNIDESLVKSTLSKISKKRGDNIVVGHHYFAPNNTVAVFDFRVRKNQPWILMGQKKGNIPAIATASKGTATEQNGAVDWLKIEAIPSMSVDFKLVYRVQTAGGKAAATCKDQPESFQIQYAAEYWIYA